MNDQVQMQPMEPVPVVELIEDISTGDLNDLCDATDAAIEGGGGFGWVDLPARDVLERYWQGVLAMPRRLLFVARLDGVICGTCQLILNPKHMEAQQHAAELSKNFVSPWARGHGLATMLVQAAEKAAKKEGLSIINLSVRENMESAIQLYEALGYARVGEHPYYADVKGKVVKGYYYYKQL